MINILQLCLSRGYGGLELYVYKTIQLLDRDKFCVFPVVRPGTLLHKRLADEGIDSFRLNISFRYFPFAAARRLARYIDQYNIDVVHMHWGHDLFIAVLAKVFSSRKPKLVYTRQMALTRPKKDPYHRYLYRQIDSHIFITQELANSAKKYLPMNPDRFSLIYYGVPEADSSSIDCEFVTSGGLQEKSFKVAIFGRIEPGKGQHLVVEAVTRLRHAGHDIQAAIIGHVMDQAYFDDLSEKISAGNLTQYIRYLGFHNQPVTIMPCFDAVILATKCETFGLVLPEAMRAGVAVIGSDCGGVPEIITHEKTGLLFKTQDIHDLTEQLARLVEKPDYCHRLAEEGKKEADRRFSQERHYRQLSELFERLVNYHD